MLYLNFRLNTIITALKESWIVEEGRGFRYLPNGLAGNHQRAKTTFMDDPWMELTIDEISYILWANGMEFLAGPSFVKQFIEFSFRNLDWLRVVPNTHNPIVVYLIRFNCPKWHRRWVQYGKLSIRWIIFFVSWKLGS